MAYSRKWNQPADGGKKVKGHGASGGGGLKVALGLVLCAAVLGGAWWWMSSRRTPTPTVTKERPRKVITPTPRVKAVPQKEQQVTEVDPGKQIAPGYRHPTNPNLPRKKWFPTVEEVEKARLGPDGKPKKKSIYKTPLEQSLGILFTTKLGSPPPMLPNITAISTPERLQKFLDTAMEYDKDAPAAVNENRIMMQQVKDELKRYLEEGGSPEGFVEFYQNELRVAHDEWKTAQKMLIEMSRGGEDPEVMRQFRDKANEILGKRGIKPLAVPPFVRASMGE